MSFVLSTVNVNGLRAAVRKGFRSWVAELQPDVLCLQEVRMEAAQATDDHRAPEGHTGFQVDAEKKGYSGVAVWTRLPVLGSRVGLGLEAADREGRAVRVDTPEGTFVSLYVPSGSSGEARQAAKDQFMIDFLPIAQGWLDEGRPFAICGDWNVAREDIDIHNPKSNVKSSGFLPHEKAWMTELLRQGWVDLFRHTHPGEKTWTWWSQRGQARALDRGWRIDYILCSPSLAERAEDCWITGREPAFSDHCAVNARFRSLG